MSSYLLGDAVRLAATITDLTGAPEDPATLTLRITAPDGTVTTRTLGDYTRDSIGAYHYDYAPPAAGTYQAVQTATVPSSVDLTDFRIVNPVDGLVPAGAYRNITGDTATPTADVLAALEDALLLAEEHCHRRFAYAAHTETLYVYRSGLIYPTNTPITAVTAPAVDVTAIQGAAVYLGAWLPVPALVNTGDWNAAVPPQTTITYLGGFQPYGTTGGVTDPLPPTVARALCRIAFLMLHPVSLDGLPAGVTSASVGGVSMSGNLSGFVVSDPSIRRDLAGWVKRQARSWQRA